MWGLVCHLASCLLRPRVASRSFLYSAHRGALSLRTRSPPPRPDLPSQPLSSVNSASAVATRRPVPPCDLCLDSLQLGSSEPLPRFPPTRSTRCSSCNLPLGTLLYGASGFIAASPTTAFWSPHLRLEDLASVKHLQILATFFDGDYMDLGITLMLSS
ncbi:hypothetical protein DAI22_04g074700 [Oryza sativa Japonica Group]|nr:hypothetical protein DAI22_04g074700 [Oryza sativa Japonica Group]